MRRPGGWKSRFSYVYFEASLTGGVGDEVVTTDGQGTGDVRVPGSRIGDRHSGMATLPISEATIVERDVIGFVHNPGPNTVPGALFAVACFNDAGELTYAY